MEGHSDPVRCPECGSSNVGPARRILPFFALAASILGAGIAIGQIDLSLLAVLILLALFLLTPAHRCGDCASRFTLIYEMRDVPDVSPDEARKLDVPCPRCGSIETYGIRHRRYKAATMLTSAISIFFAVLLLFWPFLAKRQCDDCGLRW